MDNLPNLSNIYNLMQLASSLHSIETTLRLGTYTLTWWGSFSVVTINNYCQIHQGGIAEEGTLIPSNNNPPSKDLIVMLQKFNDGLPKVIS